MDAKDALLEGLHLLYAEEYRATAVAAELLKLSPAPSPAQDILREYLDEAEEHVLRIEDLFEYLHCAMHRDRDGTLVTSSKLYLVGKSSVSSDLVETLLRLDRSTLARYRESLSLARAFGMSKVVAMLLQSFREKLAFQQLLFHALEGEHGLNCPVQREDFTSLGSRGVRQI